MHCHDTYNLPLGWEWLWSILQTVKSFSYNWVIFYVWCYTAFLDTLTLTTVFLQINTPGRLNNSPDRHVYFGTKNSKTCLCYDGDGSILYWNVKWSFGQLNFHWSRMFFQNGRSCGKYAGAVIRAGATILIYTVHTLRKL